MPLRAFRRSHLAVSVAERERDHEPLQSVEHHVEILVERLPDAVCAPLRVVESEEPVQAEQGEEDHRGVDGFPGIGVQRCF